MAPAYDLSLAFGEKVRAIVSSFSSEKLIKLNYMPLTLSYRQLVTAGPSQGTSAEMVKGEDLRSRVLPEPLIVFY